MHKINLNPPSHPLSTQAEYTTDRSKELLVWRFIFITIRLHVIVRVLFRFVACATIHRYPIFSTRYSVMCKVYTGYCGTSEIEHGVCAYTIDNPLAKARGLSLRTGTQTMLYFSLVFFTSSIWCLGWGVFCD